MKYQATTTRFSRSSGRIQPTMDKSDVVAKTALKTFVTDAIDTASADANCINLQILIRMVPEE